MSIGLYYVGIGLGYSFRYSTEHKQLNIPGALLT
jgi:hypothetical protein